MLKIYGFARVNKMARGNTRDLRVLWALEEMGLPYEIVGIDHPNLDRRSPARHSPRDHSRHPFARPAQEPPRVLRKAHLLAAGGQ